MISSQGQTSWYQYQDLITWMFMWNIKALAKTVEKMHVLARLKFLKSWPNQDQSLKNVGTQGKVFSLETLMWNIKALARKLKRFKQG